MQEQKYDIVVIGSGMGGLCAGALAVKNGYKTLVVESRERLGGRFSTEEIDGFMVPTGANLIHYSGWVPWVFKEVGAQLELRDSSEVFYRIRAEEYRVPLKHRVTALLDLCNMVGLENKKLVTGFVKEVATKKIVNAFGKAATDPRKVGGLTLKEWLLQYTDNEDAHSIFDALAIGWVVAHSYEIPAAQFFYFMSAMRGMNDVGLSPHGNRANMENLAGVIKTGGDVWTGSSVGRVLVRKGAATGVVVSKEGGNEIELSCNAVISNIGPQMTAVLAGHENYTEDYLRDLRVKTKPVPVTLIAVASDKPLCVEGGEHGGILVAGARRITGGSPLSNTCPELAPAGRHLLYLAASPPSTLIAMDEEEEVRQCTIDLKEQFPDFERHGMILKMETRNIHHDLPEGRSWQAYPYQMPQETPVKNLWNVGDGALSRGLIGTSGCAESAKRVVESVKKSIKPG